MFADPGEVLKGRVVITAPHMDDEVLACGGTIAKLPDKRQVHLIYATDGTQSPAPASSRPSSASHDLGKIRVDEAKAALSVLEVSEENIHFLSFPDSKLGNYVDELKGVLEELFERIAPSHVLTPFRFDCHPDHLALNRVVTEVVGQEPLQAQLTEYFVYYRWRLLPGRDVRKYVRADNLVQIDIQDVSEQKRRALDCFKSQTTKLFGWQQRPILTDTLLSDVCRQPEVFLRYDSMFPGARIFTRARTWIQFVHRAEPELKKRKDAMLALFRAEFPQRERESN